MNSYKFAPPEKLQLGKQRNCLTQFTFYHLSSLERMHLEIIKTYSKRQNLGLIFAFVCK